MATELATRAPAFVDGKAQNAQELRLHVLSGSGGATPLQSRAGVRPSGGDPGLVSALPTPVMKVRVNAGIADVPSSSVTGGFYRVSWDQVDLDIDPSSAQARTDLIIVEVVDTGTAAATGKVRVLKGTSGSGRPSNPVVNAHWWSLAATAVRVNAEGTGNIRPQDVTPELQYAVGPGARLPVRNQAEQDALPGFPGLEVYRLDNGQVQLCTAAGPPAVWRTTYDPAGIRGVELHSALATPIGAGTVSGLAFPTGSATYDSDGYFTGPNSLSILTIPAGRGGLYLVSHRVQLDSVSAGRFFADANTVVGGNKVSRANGTGDDIAQSSRPMRLAAGDVFKLNVFHSASGTPNVISRSLSLHLIGT